MAANITSSVEIEFHSNKVASGYITIVRAGKATKYDIAINDRGSCTLCKSDDLIGKTSKTYLNPSLIVRDYSLSAAHFERAFAILSEAIKNSDVKI